VKRVFDVCLAMMALLVLSPLLLIAAVGIRLTSPGPIFYRARRIARDRRRSASAELAAAPADRRCSHRDGYRGREFVMYKFRTMRVATEKVRPLVTAADDPRIFPFGAFLRAIKLDELPQLINVLKGDMSLVGPRPEDPEIVRSHYKPGDLETLHVHPGLTSPGTLYYFTHCEASLATDSLMEDYVERLMPLKLALDRVYIRRATVLYDIRLIARTLLGIAARVFRIDHYPRTPELAEVMQEW
jgi:lipopolysaccharide/colanic/teichoic acid biosynthesis glycosyltransferase